jgi:hypothetical protein
MKINFPAFVKRNESKEKQLFGSIQVKQNDD